jgi:drug/metabolite transporter (DMT)-like permease
VYTAPLYVALLSPWVLHEPIRRGDWLTILLAVLGLGCFCVEQLTLEGWVGNLGFREQAVPFAIEQPPSARRAE